MYGDRERTRGRIRQLLTENPSLYRESIAREYAHPVGKKRACLTHPLHDVSDMCLRALFTLGKELPLVEVLIESGADLNFQSRDPLRIANPIAVVEGWMRAATPFFC
jgi:hypothetical protein